MGKAISTNPSYPEKTAKGRVIKIAYALWNVGTEYCKDFIYGCLSSDEDVSVDDRAIHFPQGLHEEYFDVLLSEVFDKQSNKYVKRQGARYKRNEPLDTFVYAWAIGHHKAIRIGMTRNGKVDHGYWTRRAVILEPDNVIEDEIEEVQVNKLLPSAGKVSLNSWARG